MENYNSVLEAILSTIAVFGIIYTAFRRVRSHITKKIIFTTVYCSADEDTLVVKYILKNEGRRSVFVECSGLYDPDAVGDSKRVTCLRIGQSFENGASCELLAAIQATKEDLTFLERLRPYAVDKGGKLHLGLPIDPGELRAAFENRDNRRIAFSQGLSI